MLIACGPATGDDGDVYPRNCGALGPVDLFESSGPAWLWATRAGDVYLVEHSPDETTLEYWAVDRCGEERVLLETTAALAGSPLLGVAEEWILSCDEETGSMAVVDPHGVAADRVIFESVESCRVVPVGGGLAAQERGGSRVWFHPDPLDPDARAIVVTDTARIADPDWVLGCEQDFACDSDHPFGIDIRAAGDDLLVVLQDETLLAFSASSLSTRSFDAGPVFAVNVLPDGSRVIVHRDLGPTRVIDRATGEWFEFCCYDSFEPIRQLGDWLVKGSWGPPTIPEPEEWKVFRARHLDGGQTNEVIGHEIWSPLARLTDDTILVQVAGEANAVWPATGERRVVELPDGDVVWTLPGQDGVFMQLEHRVVHLAGTDTVPRTLLDEVEVAFATTRGRIVFEPPRGSGPAALPLRVMLPDEEVVEIEPRSLGVLGVFYWGDGFPTAWPAEQDEVVYLVEDGPRGVLRRTVLP